MLILRIAAFLSVLVTIGLLAWAVLWIGNDISRRSRRIRQAKMATFRRDPGAQAQEIRYGEQAFLKRLAARLQLGKWLGTETARMRLTMAGKRGPQAEISFLVARLVSPVIFGAVAIFYMFVLNVVQWSVLVKLGLCVAALYFGLKFPELMLTNRITKRQKAIRRGWPDALDLLLICVEAGMTVETGLRTVYEKLGQRTVELADELSLTLAELAYLTERRVAYENLAKRVGTEIVQTTMWTLIQAERYGTPVGDALRTFTQEMRETRMIEAEKKAAALPPLLTFPMILFFLPVLMVVIISPGIMKLIAIWPWK